MKAYFDRTLPMYLSPEPTFDGNAINIPEYVLQVCDDLNKLKEDMVLLFDELPAPEECAQEAADILASKIEDIFTAYAVAVNDAR
jgi:hypothetical protein